MTRIGGFDGHQGVLLEVGERRWSDVAEMLANARASRSRSLILVLEHLQDPTNFGTLLRSAEAAGSMASTFPERGAAPLSAAAVKASAGASEHLLIARAADDRRGDPRAQSAGLRAGRRRSGCPASAWLSDLRGPLAIVVGSEGSGLSGVTRRRCDLLVSFPMAGRVASLNASTAGALLLFEVVRQRAIVAVVGACGRMVQLRPWGCPSLEVTDVALPDALQPHARDVGTAGEQPRTVAMRRELHRVGRGKLHGFWYAFGQHDGLTLWEAPDNISMAAVAIAIGGGGHRARWRPPSC